MGQRFRVIDSDNDEVRARKTIVGPSKKGVAESRVQVNVGIVPMQALSGLGVGIKRGHPLAHFATPTCSTNRLSYFPDSEISGLGVLELLVCLRKM